MRGMRPHPPQLGQKFFERLYFGHASLQNVLQHQVADNAHQYVNNKYSRFRQPTMTINR